MPVEHLEGAILLILLFNRTDQYSANFNPNLNKIDPNIKVMRGDSFYIQIQLKNKIKILFQYWEISEIFFIVK